LSAEQVITPGADLPPAVDPVCYLFEPRPAVAVIERMTRVHLGDVRLWMELVAFLEWPVESLGEGCCDRRLPAARDAYDNEDCPNVSDVGLIRLQRR
jgi:hypothetical protein